MDDFLDSLCFRRSAARRAQRGTHIHALKRITRRLASKVCPLALLIASSAIAAESQAAVLEVQNMTCSLCPETVKKARQKVPGDEDAKVDLDHKTATVKFNPAKAKIAVLAKATTDGGFPSTLHM